MILLHYFLHDDNVTNVASKRVLLNSIAKKKKKKYEVTKF